MMTSSFVIYGFVILFSCQITAISGLNGRIGSPRCRSRPGDALYPTVEEFTSFNNSVGGRLLSIIPSGEFCHRRGGCSASQWSDANFRGDIPGAMFEVNWEQDYTSHPPSLCFLNSSMPCGQGNVPLFGVNVTTVAHIQAGIRFARAHNLKVVVKASGHDYLGRSTARNSFLLWTRYLENITFHDEFIIGKENVGSTVTVGSGVGLHSIYPAAKAQGKIYVGGTAATVVAAGGYVQGGGHSALSPLLGLASDNVVEFDVVLATGDLVKANAINNPDLFWALRGGGAGSWGVIARATFRTFPTFNAVHKQIVVSVNTTLDIAKLSALHAKHIFDWDEFHAAQYFYWRATPPTFTFTIDNVFPNTTLSAANASLVPLIDDILSVGFNISSTSLISASINDILFMNTDIGAFNQILGSRFWSDEVYNRFSSQIGDAYKELFDGGAQGVLGHLVAGGQVSKNANIDSAVHPEWRTAKTHMIVTNKWADSATPEQVEAILTDFTYRKVPILAALAGTQSGSYSNEGNRREPNFKTTFYGSNYPRLNGIKSRYDADDIFIVPTGVGSDRWDEAGFCRIH